MDLEELIIRFDKSTKLSRKFKRLYDRRGRLQKKLEDNKRELDGIQGLIVDNINELNTHWGNRGFIERRTD